jgi:hypothetical protein
VIIPANCKLPTVNCELAFILLPLSFHLSVF